MGFKSTILLSLHASISLRHQMQSLLLQLIHVLIHSRVYILHAHRHHINLIDRLIQIRRRNRKIRLELPILQILRRTLSIRHIVRILHLNHHDSPIKSNSNTTSRSLNHIILT